MAAFVAWLKGTSVSWFVTYYAWVWPACETLHFVGLCLLLGVVGLFDLRLLGFARALPVAPLFDLMPWAIAGFLINLITGLLFFIGDPGQYVSNIAFQFKMAFVLLAGMNALLFKLMVSREALAIGPGGDASLTAKVIAATSLVCWLAVLYCGRMLPFIGNAF